MGKLLDSLRKKHAAAPIKSNRHTLNFLAHKNDIAEAMREGWTAKQIWEQMTDEGMTTMSYATCCRLVKKHIMPSMGNANGTAHSAGASPLPSGPLEKAQANSSAKKSKRPVENLTEKERLDLLREEAFASVRAARQADQLIGKPKSREEENRELFGN